MKSRFNPVLRGLSSVLVIAFLCQDLSYAQGNAAPSAPLFIPKSDGMIVRSYKPEAGGEERLVVNIQDAHDSLGAQYGISRVIETLVKNYGVNLVGTEGAEGVVDTAAVSSFPDPDVRKDVAESLLRDTKISAAEYYRIISAEPVELYGLEDLDLYRQNVGAFQELLRGREQARAQVVGLAEWVDKLCEHVFPSEILELDRFRRRYQADEVSFAEYWHALETLASARGLDTLAYPNLAKMSEALTLEKRIDFKEAEEERGALVVRLREKLDRPSVETLVQKALEFKLAKISPAQFHGYLTHLAEMNGLDKALYPDLFLYAEYLGIYESVEMAALTKEVSGIDSAIRDVYLTGPDQKEADRLEHAVQTLAQFLEGTLSPEGESFYRANRELFAADELVLSIERLSQAHQVVLEKIDSAFLAERILAAEKFYQGVTDRNEVMMRNLIRRMREKGQRVAALVSGGFHSGGFSDLMEQGRISHVVIMPSFDASKGERPYITVITQKGSYLDRELRRREQEDSILMTLGAAVLKGMDFDSVRRAYLKAYRQSRSQAGMEAVVAQKDTEGSMTTEMPADPAPGKGFRALGTMSIYAAGTGDWVEAFVMSVKPGAKRGRDAMEFSTQSGPRRVLRRADNTLTVEKLEEVLPEEFDPVADFARIRREANRMEEVYRVRKTASVPMPSAASGARMAESVAPPAGREELTFDALTRTEWLGSYNTADWVGPAILKELKTKDFNPEPIRLFRHVEFSRDGRKLTLLSSNWESHVEPMINAMPDGSYRYLIVTDIDKKMQAVRYHFVVGTKTALKKFRPKESPGSEAFPLDLRKHVAEGGQSVAIMRAFSVWFQERKVVGDRIALGKAFVGRGIFRTVKGAEFLQQKFAGSDFDFVAQIEHPATLKTFLERYPGAVPVKISGNDVPSPTNPITYVASFGARLSKSHTEEALIRDVEADLRHVLDQSKKYELVSPMPLVEGHIETVAQMLRDGQLKLNGERIGVVGRTASGNIVQLGPLDRAVVHLYFDELNAHIYMNSDKVHESRTAFQLPHETVREIPVKHGFMVLMVPLMKPGKQSIADTIGGHRPWGQTVTETRNTELREEGGFNEMKKKERLRGVWSKASVLFAPHSKRKPEFIHLFFYEPTKGEWQTLLQHADNLKELNGTLGEDGFLANRRSQRPGNGEVQHIVVLPVAPLAEGLDAWLREAKKRLPEGVHIGADVIALLRTRYIRNELLRKAGDPPESTDSERSGARLAVFGTNAIFNGLNSLLRIKRSPLVMETFSGILDDRQRKQLRALLDKHPDKNVVGVFVVKLPNPKDRDKPLRVLFIKQKKETVGPEDKLLERQLVGHLYEVPGVAFVGEPWDRYVGAIDLDADNSLLAFMAVHFGYGTESGNPDREVLGRSGVDEREVERRIDGLIWRFSGYDSVVRATGSRLATLVRRSAWSAGAIGLVMVFVLGILTPAQAQVATGGLPPALPGIEDSGVPLVLGPSRIQELHEWLRSGDREHKIRALVELGRAGVYDSSAEHFATDMLIGYTYDRRRNPDMPHDLGTQVSSSFPLGTSTALRISADWILGYIMNGIEELRILHNQENPAALVAAEYYLGRISSDRRVNEGRVVRALGNMLEHPGAFVQAGAAWAWGEYAASNPSTYVGRYRYFDQLNRVAADTHRDPIARRFAIEAMGRPAFEARDPRVDTAILQILGDARENSPAVISAAAGVAARYRIRGASGLLLRHVSVQTGRVGDATYGSYQMEAYFQQSIFTSAAALPDMAQQLEQRIRGVGADDVSGGSGEYLIWLGLLQRISPADYARVMTTLTPGPGVIDRTSEPILQLRLFRTGSAQQRVISAQLLGTLGYAPALPDLLRIFRGDAGDTELRLASLDAILEMRAILPLTPALGDELGAEALEILGHRGNVSLKSDLLRHAGQLREVGVDIASIISTVSASDDTVVIAEMIAASGSLGMDGTSSVPFLLDLVSAVDFDPVFATPGQTRGTQHYLEVVTRPLFNIVLTSRAAKEEVLAQLDARILVLSRRAANRQDTFRYETVRRLRDALASQEPRGARLAAVSKLMTVAVFIAGLAGHSMAQTPDPGAGAASSFARDAVRPSNTTMDTQDARDRARTESAQITAETERQVGLLVTDLSGQTALPSFLEKLHRVMALAGSASYGRYSVEARVRAALEEKFSDPARNTLEFRLGVLRDLGSWRGGGNTVFAAWLTETIVLQELHSPGRDLNVLTAALEAFGDLPWQADYTETVFQILDLVDGPSVALGSPLITQRVHALPIYAYVHAAAPPSAMEETVFSLLERQYQESRVSRELEAFARRLDPVRQQQLASRSIAPVRLGTPQLTFSPQVGPNVGWNFEDAALRSNLAEDLDTRPILERFSQIQARTFAPGSAEFQILENFRTGVFVGDLSNPVLSRRLMASELLAYSIASGNYSSTYFEAIASAAEIERDRDVLRNLAMALSFLRSSPGSGMDPRIDTILTIRSHTTDSRTLAYLARAAGNSGDARAVEIIEAFLGSNDTTVQGGAIQAVYALPANTAFINPLLAVLQRQADTRGIGISEDWGMSDRGALWDMAVTTLQLKIRNTPENQAFRNELARVLRNRIVSDSTYMVLELDYPLLGELAPREQQRFFWHYARHSIGRYGWGIGSITTLILLALSLRFGLPFFRSAKRSFSRNKAEPAPRRYRRGENSGARLAASVSDAYYGAMARIAIALTSLSAVLLWPMEALARTVTVRRHIDYVWDIVARQLVEQGYRHISPNQMWWAVDNVVRENGLRRVGDIVYVEPGPLTVSDGALDLANYPDRATDIVTHVSATVQAAPLESVPSLSTTAIPVDHVGLTQASWIPQHGAIITPNPVSLTSLHTSSTAPDFGLLIVSVLAVVALGVIIFLARPLFSKKSRSAQPKREAIEREEADEEETLQPLWRNLANDHAVPSYAEMDIQDEPGETDFFTRLRWRLDQWADMIETRGSWPRGMILDDISTVMGQVEALHQKSAFSLDELKLNGHAFDVTNIKVHAEEIDTVLSLLESAHQNLLREYQLLGLAGPTGRKISDLTEEELSRKEELDVYVSDVQLLRRYFTISREILRRMAHADSYASYRALSVWPLVKVLFGFQNQRNVIVRSMEEHLTELSEANRALTGEPPKSPAEIRTLVGDFVLSLEKKQEADSYFSSQIFRRAHTRLAATVSALTGILTFMGSMLFFGVNPFSIIGVVASVSFFIYTVGYSWFAIGGIEREIHNYYYEMRKLDVLNLQFAQAAGVPDIESEEFGKRVFKRNVEYLNRRSMDASQRNSLDFLFVMVGSSSDEAHIDKVKDLVESNPLVVNGPNLARFYIPDDIKIDGSLFALLNAYQYLNADDNFMSLVLRVLNAKDLATRQRLRALNSHFEGYLAPGLTAQTAFRTNQELTFADLRADALIFHGKADAPVTSLRGGVLYTAGNEMQKERSLETLDYPQIRNMEMFKSVVRADKTPTKLDLALTDIFAGSLEAQKKDIGGIFNRHATALRIGRIHMRQDASLQLFGAFASIEQALGQELGLMIDDSRGQLLKLFVGVSSGTDIKGLFEDSKTRAINPFAVFDPKLSYAKQMLVFARFWKAPWDGNLLTMFHNMRKTLIAEYEKNPELVNAMSQAGILHLDRLVLAPLAAATQPSEGELLNVMQATTAALEQGLESSQRKQAAIVMVNFWSDIDKYREYLAQQKIDLSIPSLRGVVFSKGAEEHRTADVLARRGIVDSPQPLPPPPVHKSLLDVLPPVQRGGRDAGARLAQPSIVVGVPRPGGQFEDRLAIVQKVSASFPAASVRPFEITDMRSAQTVLADEVRKAGPDASGILFDTAHSPREAATELKLAIDGALRERFKARIAEAVPAGLLEEALQPGAPEKALQALSSVLPKDFIETLFRDLPEITKADLQVIDALKRSGALNLSQMAQLSSAVTPKVFAITSDLAQDEQAFPLQAKLLKKTGTKIVLISSKGGATKQDLVDQKLVGPDDIDEERQIGSEGSLTASQVIIALQSGPKPLLSSGELNEPVIIASRGKLRLDVTGRDLDFVGLVSVDGSGPVAGILLRALGEAVLGRNRHILVNPISREIVEEFKRLRRIAISA